MTTRRGFPRGPTRTHSASHERSPFRPRDADVLTASKLGVFLFVNTGAGGASPAGKEPRPAATGGKPRLVVLTDTGGDPDDQQSMVRLMLYANEFDVEGLIASAAGTPGELKQAVAKPELIREIGGAYGKVRPNLLLRRSDYTDPTGFVSD